MKTNVLCVIVLSCALSRAGRSAVAYFNGPAFPIPEEYVTTTLDINQDGTADFSFSSGPFVSPDLPCTAVTGPYFMSSVNTNSVLCQGTDAAIMPAGTSIGGVTSLNTAWRISDGARLATYGFNTCDGTSGWAGPLCGPGVGYLGIRFYVQDGVHYGWVRAWMPQVGELEAAPVIIDWAYETRPGASILAGAVPSVAVGPPRIVRPGNLRLNWQSEVGAAYQVQFKEQFSSPVWTNADFTLVATDSSASVDVPMTGTARYYRVVQAP